MLDPEEAARAIVHIFATGDLDAVSSAVADDYLDHQGLGGVDIRGQDGFRRVVEAVQQQTDVRVTIEDLVAADDKAAVWLRWEAVGDAGRAVTRETFDLLRFADGRLVEHWVRRSIGTRASSLACASAPDYTPMCRLSPRPHDDAPLPPLGSATLQR